MALYNHFPNKGAILDAVTGLGMNRIPVPPGEGPWKERIMEISRAIRKMALDQPNLFRVVMARPSPPSTAFPQIEFVLSALAAAADFIFNPDPDRQFEQGLELILRGIEADARSIRAGGNAVKKPHSR